MIVYVRKFVNAIAVTPNDGANLPFNGAIGLRAAAGGVVKVDVLNGSVGVVVPIAAGIDLDLPITKVYATGTTATGIVAFV